MDRTLAIISFMTFSSALSVRAVDPVIPQIAHDFWLPPATAAMLAAAFISYGMVLPVLGPVADSVGKKRVMIGCLVVLTVASFLCAVATTFPQLFMLRVIAGAGCGGLFPLGMAMLSDLVPLAQRQVAIGRLLAGTITGNLLGSAAAGIVADFIHWRGVFIVLGVISLIALISPDGGCAACLRRRASRSIRAPSCCATATSFASRRRASATSRCCAKASS